MDVRVEEAEEEGQVEKIIENNRQGGEERLAEKGGGKVRRRRTMALLRHSENPLNTF